MMLPIERAVVDAFRRAASIHVEPRAFYLTAADRILLGRDEVDGVPVRATRAIKPKSILYCRAGRAIHLRDPLQ